MANLARRLSGLLQPPSIPQVAESRAARIGLKSRAGSGLSAVVRQLRARRRLAVTALRLAIDALATGGRLCTQQKMSAPLFVQAAQSVFA